METKPETQDLEMEGGEWAVRRDRCLQPAASTLLLSGDRSEPGRQHLGGSPLLVHRCFRPSSNHTSPPQLLHCRCVFKAA